MFPINIDEAKIVFNDIFVVFFKFYVASHQIVYRMNTLTHFLAYLILTMTFSENNFSQEFG